MIVALSISAPLLAQDSDASALKARAKVLEKQANDLEKELEKQEKSIAKVRPAAEQAQRDLNNIKELQQRKRDEFEAFQYDKKAAALKTNQKELKKLEKDKKSLEKKQAKLDENARSAETEEAKLKAEAATRQVELSATEKARPTYTRDEERAFAEALKSKEPVDPELLQRAQEWQMHQQRQQSLEQELKTTQKGAKKSSKSAESAKRAATDNQRRLETVTAECDVLKKTTEAQAAELKTMNPKVVKKELSDYDKQIAKLQGEFDKVSRELNTTLQTINERHDELEKTKQEIREIESQLRRL